MGLGLFEGDVDNVEEALAFGESGFGFAVAGGVERIARQ